MKEPVLDYSLYREHVRHNELEILASKKCGCLACGHSSSARLVKSWFTDEQGLSASCPNCGLSYVVGDASGLDIEPGTLKLLAKIHQASATQDSRFTDYSEYCSAYYDGKIDVNQNSESLYVKYLHSLADEFHFALATHALASFYARGGSFHQPDYEEAIHYYTQAPLTYDSSALFELGTLYQRRDGKGDSKRAFEAYVKASALGSISASLRLGSYYLSGIYVKADEEFGLNCLLSGFGELYLKAFTNPMVLPELAATAFDIGSCFRNGTGCEKSPFRALRYFLLSHYFIQESANAEMVPFDAEATGEIDAIAYEEKLDGASKEVVYDEDTFFDTFLEQYDSVCPKAVLSVEEDYDTLRVQTSFGSPILILDVGNLALEKTTDCTWSFPSTQAEFPMGKSFPLTFERIETGPNYDVSFIHDDPIYGETVVMMLRFPLPEKDS